MSLKGIFPISKWDFNRGSIFSDLPKEDLELLFANGRDMEYKKGEIVFREGVFASGIYYVKEGKVKKYKLDSDNRERIIYVANAGELLGYHAILSAENHTDSAAVLENSTLVFIPGQDFLTALNKSSVLTSRLLKTLSHEFAVLSNNLTVSSHRSVRERLALHLIIVREKYKSDLNPDAPVEINMSREDLASMVGTARENFIRVLSEFKAEGILRTKGRKIIVEDVRKLIHIANHT